jgi:hypothetical protein
MATLLRRPASVSKCSGERPGALDAHPADLEDLWTAFSGQRVQRQRSRHSGPRDRSTMAERLDHGRLRAEITVCQPRPSNASPCRSSWQRAVPGRGSEVA